MFLLKEGFERGVGNVLDNMVILGSLGVVVKLFALEDVVMLQLLHELYNPH